MTWPNDVDGDVMRRLEETNFDFDLVTQIDFNIDFDSWPPNDRAISAIFQAFPDATVSSEEDYLLVRLERRLSYELVCAVQAKLSAVTEVFGGRCESWGVMHKPS